MDPFRFVVLKIVGVVAVLFAATMLSHALDQENQAIGLVIFIAIMGTMGVGALLVGGFSKRYVSHNPVPLSGLSKKVNQMGWSLIVLSLIANTLLIVVS